MRACTAAADNAVESTTLNMFDKKNRTLAEENAVQEDSQSEDLYNFVIFNHNLN
jgi:hypothetical protein